MQANHTFHIPVMGLGFTLDSPLKIGHLGINSVISIGDDELIEKIRNYYVKLLEIPSTSIARSKSPSIDSRANRITSYLNFLTERIKLNWEEMFAKAQSPKNLGTELERCLALLPNTEYVFDIFRNTCDKIDFQAGLAYLRSVCKIATVDVNIMTKVDRPSFFKGEQLTVEHNDAHASLRGFVKSKSEGAVVFSAGFNPRLYGYASKFEELFPDPFGNFKKRIVLKVSDYRSAEIQGKFLAKNGLWVSEFRVESGLNCGGHAFATEGKLLGPVLEEFELNRMKLSQSLREIISPVLVKKFGDSRADNLKIKISAQGGVGSAMEHNFLLNRYALDSVGWGSPFLLVPEVTAVDDETLQLLVEAKEKDIYLSNVSPLGVKYNNLKNNTQQSQQYMAGPIGKQGSSCPKQHLAFDTEFDAKGLCTASASYQKKKLKTIHKIEEAEKIKNKTCLCVGLGESVLKKYKISKNYNGVAICPGPNLAYFTGVYSLKEMCDHIYGRIEIKLPNRPNLFLKELELYIDYFLDESENWELSKKDRFLTSLIEGIDYYLSFSQFFTNPDRINLKQSKKLVQSFIKANNKLEVEGG